MKTIGPRKAKKLLVTVTAIILILNLLYFIKSEFGIKLGPPGHHGNLFPLGDWVWRRVRKSDSTPPRFSLFK